MSRLLKALAPPLQPIAAAMIAVFGLLPLDASAVQVVTNCADDGDGSLRNALSLATEGELIDASGLVCSTISLAHALVLGTDAQKINGPGMGNLTIDAAAAVNEPVFFHNGSGTLEIDNLTVTNGNKYRNIGPGTGGCINSNGSVKLDHVKVSNCAVKAPPNLHARGGAVYAALDLTVTDSIVTGGTTTGILNTYGGGLFAYGQMTIRRSTISNSHANAGGGIYSGGNLKIYYSTVSGNDAHSGGGIECFCGLEMKGSTISGNRGDLSAGLRLFTPRVAQLGPSFIANSTFTGNVSLTPAGSSAMEIAQPGVTISNSTIAFNEGPPSMFTGALYAYGASIDLQSTIIAENYPADFDVSTGSTSVSGAKNLIVSSLDPVPDGTITLCPLLEPLADTGGPTLTLAIKHNSPAINAGNNLIPLASDQRNSFPRVFGVAADIGAWEWQGGPDNNIFHDGFNPFPGACHN